MSISFLALVGTIPLILAQPVRLEAASSFTISNSMVCSLTAWDCEQVEEELALDNFNRAQKMCQGEGLLPLAQNQLVITRDSIAGSFAYLVRLTGIRIYKCVPRTTFSD